MCKIRVITGQLSNLHGISMSDAFYVHLLLTAVYEICALGGRLKMYKRGGGVATELRTTLVLCLYFDRGNRPRGLILVRK